MNKKAAVYVHGKGGSADEAEHFIPLFPDSDVLGFDYRSSTPWEATEEFAGYFSDLKKKYGIVTLIANSIGAYFSAAAGVDRFVDKAYFISPVTDMERLILDMLWAEGRSEVELKEKGRIKTASGEDLSREYLSYVREHPAGWAAPAAILYGLRDRLVRETDVIRFARRTGARLTVLEDGEHWFHTPEQIRFLDAWIKKEESERNGGGRQT